MKEWKVDVDVGFGIDVGIDVSVGVELNFFIFFIFSLALWLPSAGLLGSFFERKENFLFAFLPGI